MTDREQWEKSKTDWPDPPLTGGELDEMYRAMRCSGSANCWTGTSGYLAAMVNKLLVERATMLKWLRHHEAKLESMNMVPQKWSE